jgi:hypothetical protein
MAGWVLGAHHVADLGMEIALLARGAGLAVLLAALLWLFYLALEPYVRRLRPWTLISWTRLLGGGFRDPVVGRDVLIGMIWGAGLAVTLLLAQRVPGWLGQAAPLPDGGFVETLLGPGPRLSLIVGMPVNSTLLGLGALLLDLLIGPPQSTDPGSWTASATLVVVPLLLLLAVAAFRTAHGGSSGRW